MIKLLKANPLYLPQQSDLQLPKLEDFYATLYFKNNEVKHNHALLSNACLIRSEVMYRAHNGLVALATLVKVYIKYHYGWDSMQFKQISDLTIKKAKDQNLRNKMTYGAKAGDIDEMVQFKPSFANRKNKINLN